jgi:hypothetical protein
VVGINSDIVTNPKELSRTLVKKSKIFAANKK